MYTEANVGPLLLRLNRWWTAATILIVILAASSHWKAGAQQPGKAQDAPITLRYTDIRKAAGITFLQDSTPTDQKYYLETMGTVSYKEPLLMFHNLGSGHFEKSSDSLGPDFIRPVAGRGLATADFDNDGDIDAASNNRGDYPELLRNDGGNANHWLEVLLIGTKSNRDGIGSALKLTSEGFVHVQQAEDGTSYMSASDPRIHFGLGKRSKIESLVITWPSGQVDKLTNVPIDKIIAVKEGLGIVPHPFPKVPSR